MAQDREAMRARVGRRRRRRRGAGGAVARLLAVFALLPLAGRAPRYGRLVWSLATDERMPVSGKVALAGALGYLALGRDLVSDDLPLVGGLDDLVVVALAVDLFLDQVPEEVLVERLAELAISREAYDRDIAQIRRLTPGPLRRIVRRLPAAIELAQEAWDRSELGPRLRTWITKEDSLA
jgi:uncharacterized membrane protein YkvA (DUF1232 family)